MIKKILSPLLCAALSMSFVVSAQAKRSEVKNVYVEAPAETKTEEKTEGAASAPAEEQAEEVKEPEAPKNYSLSLEAAIELALKDNPQFNNYDTAIEDAKVQLKQAQKNKRDAAGKTVMIPAQLDMVALQKGFYVEQAQFNLDSKNMEKQQAEKSLAYRVTEQYYNVKLSEALLKCTEDAYSLAKKNADTVRQQFDLGLAAELDVTNAKLAEDRAKASCDSVGRGLDLAIESLKLSLQLDEEDCTLTLTDGIDYTEFGGKLDEDMQKALDSRYDMYCLKGAYEQTKNYRDYTDILGHTSSIYSASSAKVVQAEYTYTNAAKNVKLAIKSYYNSVVDAKQQLELASSEAALAEREYQVAKLKYDLGLITNSELTSKMNAVSTSLQSVEKAKLTYKLAVEKYGYETSIGLQQ